MTRYAFASILLSGSCNLRCPDCIGRSNGFDGLPSNVSEFPLRGLDRFIDLLTRHKINQISLTGTNTEPQLYRYEPELLTLLRSSLPGVRVSLHTNGTMALRKSAIFNAYDRVTVSLPSFRPETYARMTGSTVMPDWSSIFKMATVPLKVSVLITDDNRDELDQIMERCQAEGIRRLVFRQLYGASNKIDPLYGKRPVRYFGGNPVYRCGNMEITVWDFRRTRLSCFNLFSDGRISAEYTLMGRGGQHGSVCD
ncbi:radical SAM protein [bacterium]|nr:radical SAM protein [bacterium]